MAVGATAASRQLQSKASELSWIRTGGATAHSPSGSLVWLVRPCLVPTGKRKKTVNVKK